MKNLINNINNFLQIPWWLNQSLIYRKLKGGTFYKICFTDCGKLYTFWTDEYDDWIKESPKHVLLKQITY